MDVQTGDVRRNLYLYSLCTFSHVHQDKNGQKLLLTFTERYLEELSSVIVTTNIECQTDAFLDRPASPLFIPRKSGKDAETQILEGEVGTPQRH